ncbi:MAG: PQQ-binding-like beta-propeller repeat protein [Tepidisphaeraceae bacterium]|jgi:outer membrane protein assembly factor BamB
MQHRLSILLCVSAVTLGMIVFCFNVLAAAPDGEQNWPQWRGPLCSGVTPGGDPPTVWSESKNIRWKVKLPGQGTSTPIIWNNLVFVTAAIPTNQKAPPAEPAEPKPNIPAAMAGMMSAPPDVVYHFVLFCIDRQTGKALWQKICREAVPHEGHHRDHGYASHSPVTDGKHVYAWFGSRGLHCFDLDGNLKWQKDLGRMKIKMSFGEGSSPALYDNAIIINWDNEGTSFIVAFDKETGAELWRQTRDETTSWATPLVVRNAEKLQVVTSASKKIRSYDFVTGQQLWECTGMTANVIPSPVAANGIVYCLSGFRGNALLAIRLGRSGDLTGTDAIAFSIKKNTPYVPSPLLYDNRLYFFSGNAATLTCLNAATGEPFYGAQQVDGLEGVYASPVGAGGRVYLVGRNGTSAVIKNADKFEVLSTNRLGDRIDASPAIAGKDLILRGQQSLYLISEQ